MPSVRLSVLCVMLNLCAFCHDVSGTTPIASRLHTLSIHVRSHAIHESMLTLLRDELQLPPTYEPVTIGKRKYAAVQAGNLALEPCGPYPEHNYLHTNFEAMFYGLTFEPFDSAISSARDLDKRGILHGKPTENMSITDKDLCAPNVYVGFWKKANPEEIQARAAALEAKQGGPLGVIRVDEIQVGYSDDKNLKKWIDFIKPAECVEENVYRIRDSLVLRFRKNDKKQVLGITLKVRSLDRAITYLKQRNLLGRMRDREVEIDAKRTHGLRIAIRE